MLTTAFGDVFDEIDASLPCSVGQLTEMLLKARPILDISSEVRRQKQVIERGANLLIGIILEIFDARLESREACITADRVV